MNDQASGKPSGRGRRGGGARGARGGAPAAPQTQASPPQQAGAARGARESRGPAQRRGGPPQRRDQHPLLQRLWELHPRLFGRRPMPLKIGVYEDLVARHGDALPAEELKQALQQHTRSTRYLESVAGLEPRSDLDGRPVEPVAPEHVHFAIMELLRRRLNRAARAAQARAAGQGAQGAQHAAGADALAQDSAPDRDASQPADAPLPHAGADESAPPGAVTSSAPAASDAEAEAARTWALARLVALIETFGLDRAQWAERVRTQDASALALADEAFAEIAMRTARREALLRAFDASGQDIDGFAQMYGMDASAVSAALAWRARLRVAQADAARANTQAAGPDAA